MEEFLTNFENYKWVGNVAVAIGFIMLVYIVYFYFSKEGKDERGRKIFSKASMISVISLVIFSNLMAMSLDLYLINQYATAFLLQITLDVVLISYVSSILVLKKLT